MLGAGLRAWGREHLGEVEGSDDPPEPVGEGLEQTDTQQQADGEGSSHVSPGVQAHGLGQAGCGGVGLSGHPRAALLLPAPFPAEWPLPARSYQAREAVCSARMWKKVLLDSVALGRWDPQAPVPTALGPKAVIFQQLESDLTLPALILATPACRAPSCHALERPWPPPSVPLTQTSSVAHPCCLIAPLSPRTCSGLQWFSEEAGQAWSPPPLSPPICGCLRPGGVRKGSQFRGWGRMGTGCWGVKA